MDSNRPAQVLAVLILVVFAGCAGFGGSGSDAGGDSNGGAATAEWCPEGTSQRFANPQSGEQVSMEINGIVERDGRQVCHAVWETNDGEGDVQNIEMFYTENREYQLIIMYDGDGNVVREFEMENSGN